MAWTIGGWNGHWYFYDHPQQVWDEAASVPKPVDRETSRDSLGGGYLDKASIKSKKKFLKSTFRK